MDVPWGAGAELVFVGVASRWVDAGDAVAVAVVILVRIDWLRTWVHCSVASVTVPAAPVGAPQGCSAAAKAVLVRVLDRQVVVAKAKDVEAELFQPLQLADGWHPWRKRRCRRRRSTAAAAHKDCDGLWREREKGQTKRAMQMKMGRGERMRIG